MAGLGIDIFAIETFKSIYMRPFSHRIYWFAFCLLPVLGRAQAQFSGEQNEVNKTILAICKAWS